MPGAPDVGRLAPPHYEWMGDWNLVGRAPISEPILAIASYRDTVFLLQQHGWSKIGAQKVMGPFGTGDSVISKRNQGGNAIAVASGKVYILNSQQRMVSIWTTEGELLKRLRFAKNMANIRGASQLRVDDSERIYLTVRLLPSTNASWVLLRFSPSSDTPAIIYPMLPSNEHRGVMDTFA